MRVLCDYNLGYKKYPKWVDMVEETMSAHMKAFYHKHLRVGDADCCGDEKVYFKFSSGDCFLLEYSWYMTYDPEWEIHNDYYIKKCDPSILPEVMNIGDRDWIW